MFSKDSAALNVKRSENVPVIKMIITDDIEMCNTSMKYTYEWKVMDSTVISNYYTGDLWAFIIVFFKIFIIVVRKF